MLIPLSNLNNSIHCLLKLCHESHSWRGVLDTTLCDKVCQWLAAGHWFSERILVFSTNKTDWHDITEKLLNVVLNTIMLTQAQIQDFTLGGALLGEGSGKLLGIRKYKTSFLNRNWLTLYHVRHDASQRRYVQWSMIFYSWRKALLRFQYEEQKWEAFACSRKICVILFNAHYPISLRSKEKELIRMFEIVLGRGK
jgi:hypothetical protein